MPLNVDRLREIMKNRGISQAELSRKTGIPKSAISQYLSKCFAPKDGRLKKIADALGTSSAWLMGYRDDPDKDALPGLSEFEKRIIDEYRYNPEFRASVDLLIVTPKLGIFRAAKSQDGTVAPAHEERTKLQLHRLSGAPETDEDL